MKKIFVIENDINILDMVGFVFEATGYEVITSQNKVPIETIIHESPDLVLLDYYLNDGYGKDISLEIKNNQLTKHIPVIIFSAMTGLEKAAKESRADAFLEKPFDIDNLISTINDLIK